MKHLILAFFVLFKISTSAQCWEKLASKSHDVVAIHVDSTLWQWGGIGSNMETLKHPSILDSNHVWVDIAAGDQFISAIKNDGSLWAKGRNEYGQMGNGTNINQWILGQVGEDTDWAHVSCGEGHMAALKTDGSLWIWGNNTDGQLGLGLNRTNSYTPLQIGNSTDWVEVSAGLNHTLIRNSAGELHFVGAAYNSSINSQLSQVGSSSDYMTMSGGSFKDYGIRTDGSLWVWQNSGGSPTFPEQVGSATDWLMVDNGHEYSPDYHCLFLKSDGSMWAIGKNTLGQLGDGTEVSRANPVQVGTDTHWRSIVAGHYLSMALTENRERYAWGQNPYAQFGNGLSKNIPQLVESELAWRTASSSTGDRNGHTLAIKEDGSLWAWGQNNDGQLGNGSEYTHTAIPFQIGEETSWESISNGFHFSIAIKSDGTLWSWGRNGRGQLGLADNVWGETEPTQVGTGTNWSQVACGNEFVIALRSDSTLWSWGYNYNGQLGNDDDQTQYTPIQVGTDHDWTSVATGGKHCLALKEDNSLWTWGSNQHGQLGRTGNPRVPMQVGMGEWLEAGGGGFHSLAISLDHKLWTWGRNLYAQLGDGSDNDKAAPTLIGVDSTWVSVTGGYEHSYGLKADETVWSWGRNSSGQIADSLTFVQFYKTFTPTQVRDMQQVGMVDAGPVNGLCITLDGQLYTWGGSFSPTYQSNFPQLGYAQSTPLEIGNCEYCPSSNTIVEIEVCVGDTVLFGDVSYWLPGVYVDSLMSIQGCDSIVALTLSNLELPSSTLVQNGNILETNSGYTQYIWSLDGVILDQESTHQIIPLSNGEYQVTVVDENGCMSLSTFTWTSVGLNEIGDVTMTIYPNPAQELLFIEFSATSPERVIRVHDIYGKLSLSENVAQLKNQISLSGLSLGQYQLEIRDGDNKVVVPFIKE